MMPVPVHLVNETTEPSNVFLVLHMYIELKIKLELLFRLNSQRLIRYLMIRQQIFYFELSLSFDFLSLSYIFIL